MMETGDSLLQQALNLTMEQEFLLRRFEEEVKQIPREELEKRLVDAMKLLQVNQNVIRLLIRRGMEHGSL